MDSEGLFSIRGSLDGDAPSQDFAEREQFIGLKVEQEEFLIPISAVEEIIMLAPITYVPHGPQYVDGVFNLRGSIIPAINLRRILMLPKGQVTQAARIVIVRALDVKVGILVDTITQVVSLVPNDIERKNVSGGSFGADLINGISKQGDKVKGILDLAKVVLFAAGGKLMTDDEEPGAHDEAA